MEKIQGALEDLKVVDLTHFVAGPYCTKLLADFGAQVIKVERTDGGDPTRKTGPFQDDKPDPESSVLFFSLNNNKQGITLDYATTLMMPKAVPNLKEPIVWVGLT